MKIGWPPWTCPDPVVPMTPRAGGARGAVLSPSSSPPSRERRSRGVQGDRWPDALQASPHAYGSRRQRFSGPPMARVDLPRGGPDRHPDQHAHNGAAFFFNMVAGYHIATVCSRIGGRAGPRCGPQIHPATPHRFAAAPTSWHTGQAGDAAAFLRDAGEAGDPVLLLRHCRRLCRSASDASPREARRLVRPTARRGGATPPASAPIRYARA
jgi:hypothetical protein